MGEIVANYPLKLISGENMFEDFERILKSLLSFVFLDVIYHPVFYYFGLCLLKIITLNNFKCDDFGFDRKKICILGAIVFGFIFVYSMDWII